MIDQAGAQATSRSGGLARGSQPRPERRGAGQGARDWSAARRSWPAQYMTPAAVVVLTRPNPSGRAKFSLRPCGSGREQVRGLQFNGGRDDGISRSQPRR
jgi:hypothetical protein